MAFGLVDFLKMNYKSAVQCVSKNILRLVHWIRNQEYHQPKYFDVEGATV